MEWRNGGGDVDGGWIDVVGDEGVIIFRESTFRGGGVRHLFYKLTHHLHPP